jgi:hypothetical protein
MMSDEYVADLQKSMQSLATKVPKITVKRAEEIVPTVMETLVSVPCLCAQIWLLLTCDWICMSKEDAYLLQPCTIFNFPSSQIYNSSCAY